MEALIGFAIGYVVGTKQGKEGLAKLRESFDAIRSSPEFRQFVAGGASVASGAARQVMSGGSSGMIGDVVEEIARRATEAFGKTTEERKAA